MLQHTARRGSTRPRVAVIEDDAAVRRVLARILDDAGYGVIAIADGENGLRAVIECPTKTMNISLDKKMYQVDTGPIAFPDLTQRFDALVDCLRVGFVAFNAPHFADFILEQPTPVVEDGQEKCQIYHFSAPFSLPAKNVVLALASSSV